MPSGVSIPHGVATGVQIPVIVKQIPRVRHQGIGREELAQVRVVVAGVEVQQAGAVAFLAGELVVGIGNVAAAIPPVSIVAFAGLVGYPLVGHEDGAAEADAVPVIVHPPPACVGVHRFHFSVHISRSSFFYLAITGKNSGLPTWS